MGRRAVISKGATEPIRPRPSNGVAAPHRRPAGARLPRDFRNTLAVSNFTNGSLLSECRSVQERNERQLYSLTLPEDAPWRFELHSGVPRLHPSIDVNLTHYYLSQIRSVRGPEGASAVLQPRQRRCGDHLPCLQSHSFSRRMFAPTGRRADDQRYSAAVLRPPVCCRSWFERGAEYVWAHPVRQSAELFLRDVERCERCMYLSLKACLSKEPEPLRTLMNHGTTPLQALQSFSC